MKLNLLGTQLYYQKKVIMLCPQQGCGMPMILDTERCAYNERGPACSDCSLLLNQTKQLKTIIDEKYGGKIKFDYCQNEIGQPQNLYCFSFGIYICHKP